MKKARTYNYRKIMTIFDMDKQTHKELLEYLEDYTQAEEISVAHALRQMVRAFRDQRKAKSTNTD